MKKLTVMCFGTIHHEDMKFGLEQTINNTPEVEDVLVISNKPIIDYGKFVQIRDNITISDYDYFAVKNLWAHINTEFVMICQYDGMAARKDLWTDEFFNYDYIGAPWPKRFTWIQEQERVGNGGFCIRSAKLLEALRDSNIAFHDQPRFKNEDAVICQGYSAYLKKKYGIKYAPIELADKFSHEWNNPTGETFGFHGVWNFPLFFSEDICLDHLLRIPTSRWKLDQIEMLKMNCDLKSYSKLWTEIYQKLVTREN